MGNSVRRTFGTLCGGDAAKEHHEHDEDTKPVPKPREQNNVTEEEQPQTPSKKSKRAKKKKNKKKHGAKLGAVDETLDETINEAVEKNEDVAEKHVTAVEQPDGGNTVQEATTPAKVELAEEKASDEHGNITGMASQQQNSPTLKEQAAYASDNDWSAERVENGGIVNVLCGEETDESTEDEGEESFEGEAGQNKRAETISDNMKTGQSSGSLDNSAASVEPNSPIRKNAVDQYHNSPTATGSQQQIPSPTRTSFENMSVVEKGSSSSENDPNISSRVKQQTPVYLQVHEINPEELSISCVDEIFQECSIKYHLFIAANERFRLSKLKFMENGCFKECNSNIFDCLETYKEMLLVSPANQAEVSDMNVGVQFIQVEGQQLLGAIGTVRIFVQNSLKKAADVDVIEYVKEKMTEGVQLGITSKFSAPGKYRRNMKLLRNAIEAMNEVEKHVEEILEKLTTIRANITIEDEYLMNEGAGGNETEAIIIPTVKPLTPDLGVDELFSKLENFDAYNNTSPSSSLNKIQSSQESTTKVTDGTHYERKLLTSENKQPTLLEKSNESDKKPVALESGSKDILVLKPQSASKDMQAIAEIKKPAKTSNPQVFTIEQDEHNTLDFGNFILVDPNTSDIQVMRNRSRSLDSLASIKSNRSSISRFGSFEFVTDFEITIAEKNQQLMN